MRSMKFTLFGLVVFAVGFPVIDQLNTPAQTRSGDSVALRLIIGTEPARIGVQNGGLARVAVNDGATLGLMPSIDGSVVDVTIVGSSAESVGRFGLG